MAHRSAWLQSLVRPRRRRIPPSLEFGEGAVDILVTEDNEAILTEQSTDSDDTAFQTEG